MTEPHDPTESGGGTRVRLSVVIVNWNTRDLLGDCLRSVYDTVHGLSFEVFVVDNASGDGSAAMVRGLFPGVQLIENGENVGFARANNQAIAQSTGDYVLLLNPDTVVLGDAILQLAAFLDRFQDYGVAGAELLNADGTEQDSWGWYPDLVAEIPLVNRLRAHPRPSSTSIQGVSTLTVLDVPWVSGACLMFRRRICGEIGGLDEAFWLYTEETDWCYRARRAGHGVAVVIGARVRHLRRAASRQRMVVSMLWYYQSRVRFVAKHHGRLAAMMTKALLRAKVEHWRRAPGNSPLRLAYADAPEAEIVSAYSALASELSLPVPDLLARKW